MIRAGWIALVQIVVLSATSLASAAPPLDAKLAKNFKVRWSAVHYNKSVSVRNPDISQTRQATSENLTLSCQAEVVDPNLILGTSRQGIITRMTDAKGKEITLSRPATSPHDMYEGLRYERRFQRPGAIPKWRMLIRRLLRRPPPMPGPPQLVKELRPCDIAMQLDTGLLDQAGGEISSIEGYFHALAPGSLEYVEVPFEPNNTWVSLTPDLAIQVEEAVSGNTFFRYRINISPQAAMGMRPLMVGQPTPARFVAAQQFIDSNGKLIDRFGGSMSLPAHVGGVGSASGGNCEVKTVRYVIAVNASEHKIPFEIRHIPLPKP